jgi:hypothetical protein
MVHLIGIGDECLRAIVVGENSGVELCSFNKVEWGPLVEYHIGAHMHVFL